MMEDRMMTIEKLRNEVENEHRFKSVRRGYDKKTVNVYLEELEIKHREQLESEEENTRAAQDKNRQLMEHIDKMKEQIAELQNKLDNREATERAVAESMLEGLKETNSKLTEENSTKQLRIAELEEQIKTMRADVDNYTNMLVVLDKKLKQMLDEKLSECYDVIDAWEVQFDNTSKEIKEKIG